MTGIDSCDLSRPCLKEGGPLADATVSFGGYDRLVTTGPVDTSPVVTTDAFRACLEEVAADDGVDAVLAVVVPTAISDLSAAAAEAVISKPLAVAMLDRAESVQRLKRLPVAQPTADRRADTKPAVGIDPRHRNHIPRPRHSAPPRIAQGLP
jgi:acyl-CoA synthetase (NDP forming)